MGTVQLLHVGQQGAVFSCEFKVSGLGILQQQPIPQACMPQIEMSTRLPQGCAHPKANALPVRPVQPPWETLLLSLSCTLQQLLSEG